MELINDTNVGRLESQKLHTETLFDAFHNVEETTKVYINQAYRHGMVLLSSIIPSGNFLASPSPVLQDILLAICITALIQILRFYFMRPQSSTPSTNPLFLC
jgi:hypothetical protein